MGITFKVNLKIFAPTLFYRFFISLIRISPNFSVIAPNEAASLTSPRIPIVVGRAATV